MLKIKNTQLQITTYVVELDSSVFDWHICFSSRYDGPLCKQFRGQHDICHVALTGTLCASTSPKVKLAIPVNITMEASDDDICSVGFSIHKNKGTLYCYVKKSISSISVTTSKTEGLNIWS